MKQFFLLFFCASLTILTGCSALFPSKETITDRESGMGPRTHEDSWVTQWIEEGDGTPFIQGTSHVRSEFVRHETGVELRIERYVILDPEAVQTALADSTDVRSYGSRNGYVRNVPGFIPRTGLVLLGSSNILFIQLVDVDWPPIESESDIVRAFLRAINLP